METCFKILQLKFDKKLTNRCIGLTLHISASTVFEVLARFKASSLSVRHYLLIYPMTRWRNSFFRPKTPLHQSL